MESPICEKYIRENGGITLEILRVDNLKKVYGKGENAVHALDGVSFSVEQGEICSDHRTVRFRKVYVTSHSRCG